MEDGANGREHDQKPYPAELRERAVRMVREQEGEYASRCERQDTIIDPIEEVIGSKEISAVAGFLCRRIPIAETAVFGELSRDLSTVNEDKLKNV